MAETVQIEMPQMGESVTEGTVLEWHKQEGEYVAEGETVVEVSTDKIDAEVPAPASGVITKLLVAPDDTVQIGQALAELDTSAEPSGNGAERSSTDGSREQGPGLASGPTGEGDADLGDENAPTNAPQPGVTATVSRITGPAGTGRGARMPADRSDLDARDGRVGHRGHGPRVARAGGRSVAEGDTVVEVSTDKVDAEVPAPASGTITKLLVAARRHRPGRPGAGRDDRPAPRRPPTATAAAARHGSRRRARRRRPTAPTARRASPVARRVAAASGVDLGAVQGSGPGGKVTKADVLAAANGEQRRRRRLRRPRPSPAARRSRCAAPPAMLAQAMNESRSVPTATSFRTLAVDALDAKRKALNGALKERGMKVSFTHLIAWAIVEAGAASGR